MRCHQCCGDAEDFAYGRTQVRTNSESASERLCSKFWSVGTPTRMWIATRRCSSEVCFFFLRHTRMRNNSPESKSVRTEARAHTDPNKSARSGVAPSTSDIASCEPATKKEANDLAQETDNILVHRFLHAKNADLRRKGASLARSWAISSMKLRASALHRPPVSSATTTRRHSSAATSSEYLASLSRRAWVRTAPSTAAAFGRRAPQQVNALLRVMSTASCAPWRMGSPAAP